MKAMNLINNSKLGGVLNERSCGWQSFSYREAEEPEGWQCIVSGFNSGSAVAVVHNGCFLEVVSVGRCQHWDTLPGKVAFKLEPGDRRLDRWEAETLRSLKNGWMDAEALGDGLKLARRYGYGPLERAILKYRRAEEAQGPVDDEYWARLNEIKKDISRLLQPTWE